MKKYNFNPGPAVLPASTIENTAKAVLDLNGSGLSLMEISHRSKDFISIMDETVALFREILSIPQGYSVLFLGGGASLQFLMLPYNLLNKKAAYLNTGSWASNAIKQARYLGEVVEVATSKDKNFSYIPRGYGIPGDADYFHITTNNTIYGTQIREDMDTGLPLAADMSSDIFSRPVDVSKYSVIYGGAQKNLGPAGVTFVIVREDALGKVERNIPAMLDYRTHIEKGSMFNTPPVLPIYASLQTLKWIKEKGGLEALARMNAEKAELLYSEIDRNPLFEATVREKKDRSLMNACFVMSGKYTGLEADFLAAAAAKGIIGIKGHRSVGGFRASMYNAMPKEGVELLADTMREFEKAKG
ncbi:MAG: 3-phosphoserine/phosphohydroxythreonine transaminase [Elusimicrobia bacterium]|nr:3-phosphoserine/phosphohydroxythreonine transaminase [Elusimicrobiota bacterium]